jgi:hypothetical protein
VILHALYTLLYTLLQSLGLFQELSESPFSDLDGKQCRHEAEAIEKGLVRPTQELPSVGAFL